MQGKQVILIFVFEIDLNIKHIRSGRINCGTTTTVPIHTMQTVTSQSSV